MDLIKYRLVAYKHVNPLLISGVGNVQHQNSHFTSSYQTAGVKEQHLGDEG